MARDVDNTHSSQFDSDTLFFLDTETSTHNKGNPYDSRNIIVSYSSLRYGSVPNFQHRNDPGFLSGMQQGIQAGRVIVGFNIKFDLHWCSRLLNLSYVPLTLKVWDIQLAEFVISGQTSAFSSLNDALVSYGLPVKDDLVKSYWDQGISTEDIPIPILEEYNNYDVEGLLPIFEYQQMIMTDKQKQLVYLLGEDLKTLQHAEQHGIKFDRKQAEKLVAQNGTAVADIEKSLLAFLPDSFPFYLSVVFNWDSGDQLSALLYGGTITYNYATQTDEIYKSGAKVGQAYVANHWHTVDVVFPCRFVPLDNTEVKKTRGLSDNVTHFYQVDDPTLSQLRSRNKENKELLRLLKERAKIIKVGEMAESIIKKIDTMHWENNIIHGQYNQNVAITGRLSSSGPNLQNTPIEIDVLLVSRYAH